MRKYAKTPTVLQMEITECGAASLGMIFAYYGKYVPLERMRVMLGVTRDGVKASDMMRAAKKAGLECHGYRRSPEKLRELPMPCILHWEMNHFVVLEGFKGKRVYINDPAIGRRKLTFQELDDSFTGVVLTFQPTPEFQKEKKQRSISASILSRLSGQYGVLFKLFYIGLLMVFPGLILPILSQLFIDKVLGEGYTDWLTRILVAIGACLLLKGGLTYYRSVILEKLKSKMILVKGYQFISHMFRLPISFFDQRLLGDLVRRIENNHEINKFVAGDLTETVLNILIAVFYLVILFFYSPILTGISLIGVAITILLTVYANNEIANASMKMQMSDAKLANALYSGLTITDTIKASGIETEYSNRVIGYQALYSEQEQSMKRLQQVISAIPDAAGKVIDVLILYVGARLIIQGDFTIGMLIAYNSFFDSFSKPIDSLIGFFENIQTLKSNFRRVEDIERYPEEKTVEQASDRKYKLSGSITLSNVSFGYNQYKPPIIKNFSFSVRSGESIAFVGPSGCGKSTAAKIISGLYPPWEGTVAYDGLSLESIPTQLKNASISSVSQNIVLFSGTVRDNICMWNSAIMEEDMVAAAKDACIHDVIMQLPGGYNYKLDENGTNLSGGQRQRLEIARALATNPSILIMDEATSSLDPIVEKDIMDRIRMRGCTCLIVAHRLSTIRDCNQILMIHNGEIVQQGTHESLSAVPGYYRDFIRNE